MKKQQQRVSQQEAGRSMVEMLGVLAVVGVLSIGGIMGYNHAMNKNKANDLLDGVSKAAMILSQKTLTGGLVEEKDLTGTEGLSFAGYTVKSLAQAEGQDYFEVQATGVPKKICSLLLDINMASANQTYLGGIDGGTLIWKNGVDQDADYTCADENNTITWAFDNNLDATVEYESGMEPTPSPTPTPTPSPTPTPQWCNEESRPGDEDGWECTQAGWECPSDFCSQGPNAGKCMNECGCDPADKPDDGDGWTCSKWGWWGCGTGIRCDYGPDAGKQCMNSCSCGESPDGEDGWVCDHHTGKLSCGAWACDYGPDAGKCMQTCDCGQKPDDGDWECMGDGEWRCYASGIMGPCEDGPDKGKCTECRCDPAPAGEDGYDCYGGVLYCMPGTCGAGPNEGKCMWDCGS